MIFGHLQTRITFDHIETVGWFLIINELSYDIQSDKGYKEWFIWIKAIENFDIFLSPDFFFAIRS